MRFICNKYLTNWYRYGFVSLFNWYLAGAANYNGPFGTWALTENFENSQKLRALDWAKGHCQISGKARRAGNPSDPDFRLDAF